MKIETDNMYRTRNGLKATVYHKVLDEKTDQHFVVDERGYTFAVDGEGNAGVVWLNNTHFIFHTDHPLDLILYISKCVMKKHPKWKVAPEAKDTHKNYVKSDEFKKYANEK